MSQHRDSLPSKFTIVATRLCMGLQQAWYGYERFTFGCALTEEQRRHFCLIHKANDIGEVLEIFDTYAEAEHVQTTFWETHGHWCIIYVPAADDSVFGLPTPFSGSAEMLEIECRRGMQRDVRHKYRFFNREGCVIKTFEDRETAERVRDQHWMSTNEWYFIWPPFCDY